jgi:hypothetical protein
MSDEHAVFYAYNLPTLSCIPKYCNKLVLGPKIDYLPEKFLFEDSCIKELDMSQCINLREIPDQFCMYTCIETIIWPPNIVSIHRECLRGSICLRKADLSYCTRLSNIGMIFCGYTNITELILPESVTRICLYFLVCNKTLEYLDLRHCIKLETIISCFCSETNIKCIRFPANLIYMYSHLCFNSTGVQELDFSLCKNVKIDTDYMGKVNTLKIYTFNNFKKSDLLVCSDILVKFKSVISFCCENLYILNIMRNDWLRLCHIRGLKNVFLPEGKFCVLNAHPEVNFYIKKCRFLLENLKVFEDHICRLHYMQFIDMPLDTMV